MEIQGFSIGAKADAIAEKLKSVFNSDDVPASRPVKCANDRISSLDQSVSSKELASVIASFGECAVDNVKVKGPNQSKDSTFSAIVSCPVATTRRLVEDRRLLVGWVSAKIRALKLQPQRCFRCLFSGHICAECNAEVNYSNRCFKCSQLGHK